jgi:hypothetical protein
MTAPGGLEDTPYHKSCQGVLSMSIYERSQYLFTLEKTIKVELNEGVFTALGFPSDGPFHANCEHFWRDVCLQVFYTYPWDPFKQHVMRL